MKSWSSDKTIWNGGNMKHNRLMKIGANITWMSHLSWSSWIVISCSNRSKLSRIRHSNVLNKLSGSKINLGKSTTKKSTTRNLNVRKRCRGTRARLSSRKRLSLESKLRMKTRSHCASLNKSKPSSWNAIWTSKWSMSANRWRIQLELLTTYRFKMSIGP